MSTSDILEKLLELKYARIRIIYSSCKGYTRQKTAEFYKITAGAVGFQLDEAVKDFEEIIPDLYFEEEGESKRKRLIAALDKDVDELFKPYEIKHPKDLLPTLWDEIRWKKKLEINGKRPEETEGEEPEIIDPPRRPLWELLLHQINELWNRIPDGLPRVLVPGLGLGVMFILFVWVLTECGGPPPPTPTSEPTTEVADVAPEEPTEDPQVDPPADTVTPITPTDTHTPTITLTPTLTPTLTITLTPTITPTPVVIDDNLPLKFEGTMTQPYSGTFPMIFYIEERNGDRVSGKTHYPELYNLIYGWEGIIVHDFGDIVENSKWTQLDVFGSEGGTWIKETRRWNIQGTHSALDGNYYLYISETGKVTGSWFRWNNVEPGPPFTLYVTE